MYRTDIKIWATASQIIFNINLINANTIHTKKGLTIPFIVCTVFVCVCVYIYLFKYARVCVY